MRILHWYPNFLAGDGVAKALLGLLESEARLGADIGIAAVKRNAPPPRDAMYAGSGVTLLEWEPRRAAGSGGLFARWLPPETARALRAFRPDIVHVHGVFDPNTHWVPWLFGCPIVLSPHGGFHPMVFTKSQSAAQKLYFSAARHMVYRRVRAFHALSRLERADLIRLLPGAVVYCAPLGPSVRTRLSVSEGARADDAVRFVFVGRLDVFTKGLDFLLEAFAEVEARLRGRREIVLTLVGPDWGGGQAWLEHRKEQLGITSRVIFTGVVPGADVGPILHQSDIYVQLSRYDNYTLSLTEALCAGKPAVLSAMVGHASYPEVTSLPHVRVVPLRANEAADAMADFALRLPEFKALAAQNRAKVQAFCSWDRVAGLHLQIYESIRRAGMPEKRPSRGQSLPEQASVLPSVKLGPPASYQRHGNIGREGAPLQERVPHVVRD
jgi:glycosyltransferase involved in cell wall biosynthesis